MSYNSDAEDRYELNHAIAENKYMYGRRIKVVKERLKFDRKHDEREDEHLSRNNNIESKRTGLQGRGVELDDKRHQLDME